MKILLLGEFSALHKNLKEGLVKLGHDVTIASSGDGWKAIDRDIDIDYTKKLIPQKLSNRIYPFIDIKKLIGYDIVQIISPDVLFKKYFPRKFFFFLIKKNNKRVFLLGAGSDGFFWKYGREHLVYGPFNDTLKYDLKTQKHPSENIDFMGFNEYIANNVDGIIPIMYEYAISYKGHESLLTTIPIPINTDKIRYKTNKVLDKIVVFHGLSRYGFKGTRHVEEAFAILEKKYPNELELIIDGKMPLEKYLEVMRKTNIVIDQTNSYSLGVNGIYAMAMGKVVLGGAEPESLKALGVISSPVINIKPNAQSIVEEIEKLLSNKENLEALGKESRKFAEEVHGHIKVAKQYLDVWC
jgi:glycosyltransferase involved in cell wall biosynthesis